MDLITKMGTLSIEKFNKCGEVFRSPIMNEKQYVFLSCMYCNTISWEFDNFLQHLDKTHKLINNTISLANPISNSENDPLNERHYDYDELLPGACKVEIADSAECNDIKVKTEIEIIGRIHTHINETCKNTSDNENSCDEYCEPDKVTAEDDNNESTEECNDDDDNNDTDDIVFAPKHKEGDRKTSLKHFTKNREFILAVINGYKKQSMLWDNSYKSKKCTASEKQKAFGTLLKEINEKFKINATLQQIERIIKRLKLRFVHHLRLKDKGETCKPLWFFELLTFLEPHLKENKLNRGICKQLNDKQLVALINLLKDNECFWNENNIYHTSVINKHKILKLMTDNFSKMCDIKELNVDIMQNTIDEIIEMAIEENVSKMQHKESNKNDEYKSSNKFFKEIQFLLPHVGPFKCQYCPKIFADIYAFKFHISKHEGTKPFKCMECRRELTHKKEFVCHLRRHTKECPFQCNTCDKSFPSQKEWHRHVIKHGSKPYVCELCADSFYTQHQLTNHMKNHNNIRDHVCPECGKGFTHRGLLRQHLQTHKKTKCFCTLCDNIYSNPRSLRKHYVRVHESGQQQSNASKAQYNCHICKITFSTIQDAKKHRKEHKQSNPAERRHACDICGHHFAYPRNLADHKKTHSNIRDQVCDVCGKAFTNANLLNQHKNVHTGEKFVCKACGKDYAHYRGLCRHITKVHGTNIRDLDALLEKQKLEASSQ